MKAGIAALVAGYVLSQFYRAFLAVLTPALTRDLGASAEDLGRASGLWFLTFALMQLPVGSALDRFGPRRTAAILLALGGGGGAAIFAAAQTPGHIQLAMALIGVGCAPILMASYFLFAKVYPPALFATLAGAMVGAGSLGNIAGSIPLAWLVEATGWRPALWGLAIATVITAALLWVFVTDPPRESARNEGSILDLLRMPVLWVIFPLLSLNYIAAAGLRGLWIGPWLRDMHGLDASGIGWASLVMGLAMIAGYVAYGPADRLFGTRKWVILAGNVICALGCLALAANPAMALVPAIALVAAIGFFGASYPMGLAHARAFAPPHLTGRGVTLMNFFSIGGAGVFQYGSGWVHAASGGSYGVLFLFFGLPLLAACAIFAFARDNMS